jgi:adenine specific DNA methylase Mod
MDVAVWTWGQMDDKKKYMYKSVNKINKLFIFIIIILMPKIFIQKNFTIAI